MNKMIENLVVPSSYEEALLVIDELEEHALISHDPELQLDWSDYDAEFEHCQGRTTLLDQYLRGNVKIRYIDEAIECYDVTRHETTLAIYASIASFPATIRILMEKIRSIETENKLLKDGYSKMFPGVDIEEVKEKIKSHTEENVEKPQRKPERSDTPPNCPEPNGPSYNPFGHS